MNPAEQRDHKRRTDMLEARIVEAEGNARQALMNVGTEIMQQVRNERTHRLKMAEEQRTYVDDADRRLREFIEAQDTRLLAQETRLTAYLSLTFWGRLRWLFTGQVRP